MSSDGYDAGVKFGHLQFRRRRSAERKPFPGRTLTFRVRADTFKKPSIFSKTQACKIRIIGNFVENHYNETCFSWNFLKIFDFFPFKLAFLG